MKKYQLFSKVVQASSSTIGKPIIEPFGKENHFGIGKDSGLTAYIERFNGTLRQRLSRLVRKTLSFSKSLENHIGAIKYFICKYNLERKTLHF